MRIDDLVEGHLPFVPVLEMVRSLGLGFMQDLIIAGRELNAEEIVDLGMVSALVRSTLTINDRFVSNYPAAPHPEGAPRA